MYYYLEYNKSLKHKKTQLNSIHNCLQLALLPKSPLDGAIKIDFFNNWDLKAAQKIQNKEYYQF